MVLLENEGPGLSGGVVYGCQRVIAAAEPGPFQSAERERRRSRHGEPLGRRSCWIEWGRNAVNHGLTPSAIADKALEPLREQRLATRRPAGTPVSLTLLRVLAGHT